MIAEAIVLVKSYNFGALNEQLTKTNCPQNH